VLLEFRLVVLVAVLDFLQLRLDLLHLRHRRVGLVGQRQEDQLDRHRDQQDRNAEITEDAEEPFDGKEHRLGEEVEPAPVDQQLKALNAELGLIAIDDGDFLGPGKQLVLDSHA
jgi:hypothetical protein